MSDTSTHTLAGLLATLSPDAHTRGKQFEHISKWWLSNTPVKPFGEHTIEDIWLWDEWPNRPGPDTGIDLVARLSDGSLCAIQAKCIDESADIPKSQLDSFISAASTRIYAHRLLIATTDGLSANARRMLQEQHVIRVMRTELENSLSIWPDGIDQLTTPIAQPKWGPRPHQQEAITNVVSGLQEHDRGQLIMACGTGKTLTALWITEQLKPQTTLVLVPSLSLLSQTLSEWAQHTNTTWSYICVCSDDTVNKNNDEPISTVDDFPFEVTTDPTRITRFLGTEGQKVIFSTYQSSAQVAAALQQAKTSIDFAICDEAHRLTGKTDGNYASILSDDKIPATTRLFMTATPRTYTASVKKKAEERGVEVTSMDDKTIYGPVLHKLSFGEAIDRGLLSDYKVVIVGVTDPQVQELIDRRELVTINNDVETDARTLAAHIGLAKATKDYNLTRTISFHSRINTAAKFAQDHPKILEWLPDTHRPEGQAWADTISGAMNTTQRNRILKQLSKDDPDRHALLTNARCLTEGVDVPNLDAVAFIDPRSSQVDIIQAVGRSIRKSKRKETGFIILPIFIPTTADPHQAFEDSAFKPIWAILNALRAHDEDLSDRFAILRTQLGRTSELGVFPEKIQVDLPSDLGQNLVEFVTALQVSIINQNSSTWDWWFGLFESFVSANGNSLIPYNFTFEGHRLGRWVVVQRSHFNRGLLSQQQIKRLGALQGWTWDPRLDQWETGIQSLAEFVKRNGHCRPSKNEQIDGFRLGSWVGGQRQRRSKGTISEDRIARLDELGFEWKINAGHGEFFDNFIRHLEIWIAEGGDPNPQQQKSPVLTKMSDGYNIAAQAVQARRAIAGGVKNVLPSQSQLERLEELGFKFKIMRQKSLTELTEVLRTIDLDSPITRQTLDQVSIDKIAINSRLKVGCHCPDCGYDWITPLRFLTNARVPCPRCRKTAPAANAKTLLSAHPNWQFIESVWDFGANERIGLDPTKVGAGSGRWAAHLCCPDCGHKWTRRINVLCRAFSCPACVSRGQRFRPEVIKFIRASVLVDSDVTKVCRRFGIQKEPLLRLLDKSNQLDSNH